MDSLVMAMDCMDGGMVNAQLFRRMGSKFSGWWTSHTLPFKWGTDRHIFCTYIQRQGLEFIQAEYKVTRAEISGTCFLSGIEGED